MVPEELTPLVRSRTGQDLPNFGTAQPISALTMQASNPPSPIGAVSLRNDSAVPQL